VEILATEAPWSALPDSPGLPRQTCRGSPGYILDLFQEICARQACPPKVTSARVENNPLSRAQNGSGGSASTRGSSRVNGCRACGDGVEMVWRFTGCTIALARYSGITPDHGNH
jgi:hypothetical protein